MVNIIIILLPTYSFSKTPFRMCSTNPKCQSGSCSVWEMRSYQSKWQEEYLWWCSKGTFLVVSANPPSPFLPSWAHVVRLCPRNSLASKCGLRTESCWLCYFRPPISRCKRSFPDSSWGGWMQSWMRPREMGSLRDEKTWISDSSHGEGTPTHEGPSCWIGT